MNVHSQRRDLGRAAATAAAIASAAGVGLSVANLTADGLPRAAAAGSDAGEAAVVDGPAGNPLTTGGSLTGFTLKLPPPAGSPSGAVASCTGDSPNANYRVQSYMVPVSVDPATLTFGSQGPTAATGEFRAPLYDTTGTPYVNRQTSAATPPATEGPIIQTLPTFDYAVYDATFPLPVGIYNVGIACTLGPAGPTQVDRYWNTVKTFTADPADSGPAKIKWALTAAQTPPTTDTTQPGSSSTSSPSSSSPSSSPASSASPSSASSSSSSSSSSSVAGSDGSGSGLASGADSGSGSGSDGGAESAGLASSGGTGTGLARTGRSFLPLLVSSFLLVCFGRAAVLLGRRPRLFDEQ